MEGCEILCVCKKFLPREGSTTAVAAVRVWFEKISGNREELFPDFLSGTGGKTKAKQLQTTPDYENSNYHPLNMRPPGPLFVQQFLHRPTDHRPNYFRSANQLVQSGQRPQKLRHGRRQNRWQGRETRGDDQIHREKDQWLWYPDAKCAFGKHAGVRKFPPGWSPEGRFQLRSSWSGGRGGLGREVLVIVPGHPTARVGDDRLGISDHGQQVDKRIGLVGAASLDETHEQVPHIGSPGCAIVQTVFPMEDRHLQHPLGDVMPTAGLCRAGLGNSDFLRKMQIPVLIGPA